MDKIKVSKRKLFQIFVSEFICTFVLVFSGSTALVLIKTIGHLGVSLVHGMSLCVSQIIGSNVSGGESNPAITLSTYISGKIGIINTIVRFIAQLTASISAACFMLVFFNVSENNLGMPTVGPIVGIGGALVYEIMYSTILILVSLRSPPMLKPFACGFVLSIANVNGADISNGALNPARAFGSYVIIGKHLENLVVYTLAPILGSIIASFINILLELDIDKHFIKKSEIY